MTLAIVVIIAFVSGYVSGWVQRGWTNDRPRPLTEEEQCEWLERKLHCVEAEHRSMDQ